jgi:hypothetical protein
MSCCKYVSREESEAGTCHSRVTSVNTPCVSSQDTTAGVKVQGIVKSRETYYESCFTTDEKVSQHHGGTCQDSSMEGRQTRLLHSKLARDGSA